MAYEFSIPRTGSDPFLLSLGSGHILFVLGANGSGKSSLMHRLYISHQSCAKRISAHRQTWFPSNAVSLSPAQRRQTEVEISRLDLRAEARWQDKFSADRPSVALYDLVNAENVRARAITAAAESGDLDLVKQLAREDAPIKIINELMRQSNLPIEISVRQDEEVFASRAGSDLYSIEQLSDGERNALLIAASVLTADPDTLVLIDEPERHLHRSIISPLLTLLFSRRPDCAFVVSTHDVLLPVDNPTAQTLLVRGCTFDGSTHQTWDLDLVPAGHEIEPVVKQDILGSRRKILFVEGTHGSLDSPLYSLLFPDVSVVPKSSCRVVEHAVSSIRDAEDLHWVRAFGIVDNDRRSPKDVDRLQAKGVFATPFYSVESLYYHPDLQRRVVTRHAQVTGEDASVLVEQATTAALDAIHRNIPRLSARAAEKSIREQFLARLPTQSDISEGVEISFALDTTASVDRERAKLVAAVDARDLTTIITDFPVRETGALDAIARHLGFSGRQQYESALRALLIYDPDALGLARSFLGALYDEIQSA